MGDSVMLNGEESTQDEVDVREHRRRDRESDERERDTPLPECPCRHPPQHSYRDVTHDINHRPPPEYVYK